MEELTSREKALIITLIELSNTMPLLDTVNAELEKIKLKLKE